MIERWPSGRRGGASWPWILTLFSLLMLALRLVPEFGPSDFDPVRSWGFAPAEVIAALQGPPADWMNAGVAGLLTALFVHGDWLHLAGNLAYLWVFGITVERALGPWTFAAGFLMLGAAANLVLAWQTGASSTPVIGASGGVSAIIGLYLGLFPVRRMGLWVPLGLYLQFARVPAVLVIGSWFTLQLIYTLLGGDGGAVAWWAHVAGFLAGIALALVLRPFPGLVNLYLQDD